jgi:hypothetical protein
MLCILKRKEKTVEFWKLLIMGADARHSCKFRRY